MEMNVNPMSFVNQHRHVVTMGKLYDFLQMCTYSEVSGVDNKNRFGVRVTLEGSADR
ncbi:hypothetical protein D3C85_1922260 [compost metagenome]